MSEVKSAALELGTERIRKLLVQYAVPAIIAMTASSLYNMVDSIFIGQGVGPLAISGLALTFPLMNLSAAFGAMVGVGASTLISMRLGQRDYATAQQVLGNVVVLNTIIGVLFGAAMLLFMEPVLYFFGASEATLPYAREYMEIILYGNAALCAAKSKNPFSLRCFRGRILRLATLAQDDSGSCYPVAPI